MYLTSISDYVARYQKNEATAISIEHWCPSLQTLAPRLHPGRVYKGTGMVSLTFDVSDVNFRWFAFVPKKSTFVPRRPLLFLHRPLLFLAWSSVRTYV